MSADRDERVARIVEVGAKERTDREAVAECIVSMTPEACEQLIAGTPKGNPLEAARIAGVMGVKRTPDLLPFCHPIAVTGAEVLVEPDEATGTIRVRTTVRAHDRTGVEMEALTAAAVTAIGWQNGNRSGVRLTPITPATRAASSGFPFGVPATSCAQACGVIETMHSATASRSVISFAPTSTIRATRSSRSVDTISPPSSGTG